MRGSSYSGTLSACISSSPAPCTWRHTTVDDRFAPARCGTATRALAFRARLVARESCRRSACLRSACPLLRPLEVLIPQATAPGSTRREAACFLVNCFIMMSNLVFGPQKRRTTRAERQDYLFVHDLLRYCKGRGYFVQGPQGLGDASKSRAYTIQALHNRSAPSCLAAS